MSAQGKEAEGHGVCGEPALDGDQVAAYLANNAEFFLDRQDLLEQLEMPWRLREDGVIDFQQQAMRRQRDHIGYLTRCRDELVAMSRGNRHNQGRIHTAVLAMLEARSFEHLIEIVTVDFSTTLGVDVAMLCIERAPKEPGTIRRPGLCQLPTNAVDNLLGAGRDCLLRSDIEGDPSVYGGAASLVRSEALVRLNISSGAPSGLLAFGARDPEGFAPHQGTDLLCFLARAVEGSIRLWLDQET